MLIGDKHPNVSLVRNSLSFDRMYKEGAILARVEMLIHEPHTDINHMEDISQ
jgi:hypothetical protein